VGTEPVVVELTDIRPVANPSKEQLKSILLTRMQGSNDWKNLWLKKRCPSNLQAALSELDALYYE
jgi:hypothetical protein